MSAPGYQLTEWEKSLVGRLRNIQAGLVVSTLEELRAIRSVTICAMYLAQAGHGVRQITRWSEVSTTRTSLENPNDPPVQVTQVALFKMISDFLEGTRRDENGKLVPQEGILILVDIQKILMRETGIVRKLREAATQIRNCGWHKTIIIMGDSFALPPELRTEFVSVDFDIPTTGLLSRVLAKMLSDIRERGGEAYAHIQPSEEILKAFASACTGLTEGEMLSLASSCIAKFATIDERGVQFAHQEKARVLLQGGALSIRKPRGGMEIVGGMETVKAWVASVKSLIQNADDASQYGLKIPSGLLLVGCSGGGKSLVAEALGGEWKLPVLLFDVGAAYGSLVGESEANIRRMQRMANAMKPCVVYIDEIEKGLGGDGMDGGTSNRCKQSLLTWLNDKDPQIFVVATANDLNKLNQIPELTRAGRFDAQFFVDLPGVLARFEIFRIHLRATGHEMPNKELAEVVGVTHGYSGAEIEAIVQDALRCAFNMMPRIPHPTREILVECARGRKPLSVTMKGAIDQLRDLVKSGRITAAGSSMEDDARRLFQESEKRVLDDSRGALPGFLDSLGLGGVG